MTKYYILLAMLFIVFSIAIGILIYRAYTSDQFFKKNASTVSFLF